VSRYGADVDNDCDDGDFLRMRASVRCVFVDRDGTTCQRAPPNHETSEPTANYFAFAVII
jgi:hypothetical protein